MLDLQRRLEILGDDGKHEPHVALEIGLQHVAGTELEPGATRPRYSGDEGSTTLGVESADALRYRRQVGRDRHRSRRRLGVYLAVHGLHPHGRLTLRRRAERRQHGGEVGHWRISVRRTVLPRPSSNRSTRSMSWRIRKSPRPSSRSTFPGVVGSSVHFSRSNPAPSSCTSIMRRAVSTRAMTWTCFAGSSLLPRRIAFESASVSATARFSIN